MSLSWHRTLRIALSPHQVAMVRLSRGFWPHATDHKCLPCGAPGAQPNWSATMAALRELLAQPNVGNAETTVILSNHFVRYLVLPWSAELLTSAEELEFARARFVQVYGEMARNWIIRIDKAPPGAGRLAAATDLALVEALTRILGAAGLRLASCQPALMAQFNGSRNRIGVDAWLVSAEQGRLLIARTHRGQWHSVRARAIRGTPVALCELLEQEQVLLSVGTLNDKVFLSIADETAIDTGDLHLERLGPRGRGKPVSTSFMLAMAGMR